MLTLEQTFDIINLSNVIEVYNEISKYNGRKYIEIRHIYFR